MPINTLAFIAGHGSRDPRSSHWLEVSQPHHYLGEACGFLTWMWIFYRAKQDLPVVLGWRHPWEHAEDPWKIVDHVDDLEGLEKSWDEVSRYC